MKRFPASRTSGTRKSIEFINAYGITGRLHFFDKINTHAVELSSAVCDKFTKLFVRKIGTVCKNMDLSAVIVARYFNGGNTIYGTVFRYFAKLRRAFENIVIRNGKVYSDKTREASFIGFPNLDVMAIYPDGSLMVYDSDEKTADEYLAMGAISTLAFGPYLVRGGEINYDGMKRINDYNNPRVALGMVEPGHTVALMVEGRHKASRGCKLPRLAEIMAAEGCTEAINLDGGASGCMVFMGEQINVVGGSKTKGGYARKGTELLGIGHSQLVQKYDVKTKK